MAQVKLTSDRGSMEKRIADRLRNSGCDTADTTVQKGDGPTRTFHNLHVKGQGAAPRRVKVEER